MAEALWLAGALAITLLFTSWTMAPAFRERDVVQDDARQHVFWMLRFRDPELFRDDPIVAYYQAVAPPGYVALYRGLDLLVDPLTASKLLPPFLGLVAALFTYAATRRLFPHPLAAFLAAVLLSRYAWQHSALTSATPRAFLLPLLAALLWALVGGRRAAAVAIIALGAALYPVAAAIGLALLGVRLVRLRGWRPYLSRDRADWLVLLVALALAAVLVLPTQRATAEFGPIVSAAQARAMPEFGEDGHSVFFVDDWQTYWLKANRSGLDLSVVDARFRAIPIFYEHLAVAALLPLLLVFGRRLPALDLLSRHAAILAQLIVASLGLFFLAHLLLFRLYLPGRYVKWSLPLVVSIAGGLAIAMLCHELARRWPDRRGRLAALTLAAAVALVVAAYPGRWQGKFLPDPNPEVTAYLATLPADTIVAGAPSETDWVPTFAGRSVVAAREYMLPYHLGYYDQMRGRTVDLIEAYYAESPDTIARFAARYGVDVFLVNRLAFDDRKFTDAWGSAFEPYGSLIRSKLDAKVRFALLDLARRCEELDVGPILAMPARCLQTRR